MTRIASDGIDVSLSRNIVIDCNACTEFRPAPGAHPDCFQLWSRPAAPPTADIVITSNSAVGDMQGISLFNHVRDGTNDGGATGSTVKSASGASGRMSSGSTGGGEASTGNGGAG